jgi:hypothetical protein
MQFLRGDEREPFSEIEAHLITEYAQGPRTRAIVLARTVIADMPQKVEVRPHG